MSFNLVWFRKLIVLYENWDGYRSWLCEFTTAKTGFWRFRILMPMTDNREVKIVNTKCVSLLFSTKRLMRKSHGFGSLEPSFVEPLCDSNATVNASLGERMGTFLMKKEWEVSIELVGTRVWWNWSEYIVSRRNLCKSGMREQRWRVWPGGSIFRYGHYKPRIASWITFWECTAAIYWRIWTGKRGNDNNDLLHEDRKWALNVLEGSTISRLTEL